MNCYVCGLDAGRTELGFSKITHPECAPGEDRWVEWYQETARHSEAGDLLLAHALKKR